MTEKSYYGFLHAVVNPYKGCKTLQNSLCIHPYYYAIPFA